ncbi:MAG TPA: peptidylprolyl isomerase [Candidatus Cloacimonadota bacterium]|nr:peptidylprolyl isomerase [Candidatus Cloacimonadota bacterium]
MQFRIGFLTLCLVFLLIVPLQARYFARWHTSMGNFTVELRDDLAPITANNFIDLANSHFYDGLQFHRVISGFMIQDGDPLGNGYGGPGYTIADEFNVGLHHDVPGMLAMANTGQPHSGGSQYYITVAPYPSGDGHYSIFGKVLEGMDVVYAISNVPTNANDHPITPVYINTLEILGLVINSVSPADSVVTYDLQNPYPFIMESYGLITNATYQWFVDDTLQPANDFLFTPEFSSLGSHTVKCITSDETVSWSFTWHVNVSGVANDDPVESTPGLYFSGNYPNPFHAMTALVWHVKSSTPLTMSVYNIRGQKVRESVLNSDSGYKQWVWDGKDIQGIEQPAGVYLFEMKSKYGTQIRKGIRY